MEYISGVTLEEKAGSGGMAEEEVIQVGKQAAEALEAAHEQGLINRDLKPGNLMVTPRGLLKVVDFGLAKLLRPRVPLDKTLTLDGSLSLTGTLPYMAPEQLQGGEVDERTDIHALGAILYELATGKRPFPEETPSQVMQAILSREPDSPRTINPEISEGLERVILKCLEKLPADRYASARELVSDLSQVEAGDLSALVAGKVRGGRTKPVATAASSWSFASRCGGSSPGFKYRRDKRFCDRPVARSSGAVAGCSSPGKSLSRP